MIYEERYLKFVGEKKFLSDKLLIPLELSYTSQSWHIFRTSNWKCNNNTIINNIINNLSKNKQSKYECNNYIWHTITCYNGLYQPINGICINSNNNNNLINIIRNILLVGCILILYTVCVICCL